MHWVPEERLLQWEQSGGILWALREEGSRLQRTEWLRSDRDRQLSTETAPSVCTQGTAGLGEGSSQHPRLCRYSPQHVNWGPHAVQAPGPRPAPAKFKAQRMPLSFFYQAPTRPYNQTRGNQGKNNPQRPLQL